jgi:hypothetical protein
MAGGGRFDLTGIELESDTINSKYFFFVRRNVNTTGFNVVTLDHRNAVFSAFNNLDQMRDIHDNPVGGLDSAWLNFRTMIASTHGTSENIFSGFTPQTAQLFFDTIASSVSVAEQLFSLQGDQALLLAKLSAGVKAQDDLTLPSGSQNLGDLSFTFDYKNSSSPIEKTEPFIEVDEHEFDDSGGRILGYGIGYNLPDLRYVHLMSNRNPTGLNPERYISMSAGIAPFNVHYFPSYLSSAPIGKTTTPDFIMDGHGDIVFFERKPFRPDLSEYVNLQTLPSGDTLALQENSNTEVQFPKFQFLYASNNSSDLGITQYLPDGFDDGGVISSNGMSAQAFANPNASVYRRFTAQMFSHNRSLQGASLWVGNSAFYYDYAVNKNSDRYRLLASAQQYNLLGQVGQTTIDYEFTVTATPVVALRNCFLPSLDFFQILGDGRLTQWLRPEQNGTVRLVIFDPKNNMDSVVLSLLKNNGTEISLTTTHPSAKEYVGTIPKDIPDGFLDVSATVHNTDGNTFHLTVSPAFYFGASMDSVQFEARVRMGRYTLNNVDLVRFNAGDTLRYTLAYANYGNYTARNVSVHFPQTHYFTPVGDTTVTIDSIRASGVERFWYRIPLTLVFLGKKQPAEMQSYYTPTITWNSGGRLFSRKNSILVDFNGTPTNITEFGNAAPKEYSLSHNYPNPFNPTTTISFQLPALSRISLKVYDLLGREIAMLVNEQRPIGNYSVKWDASNLPSGVYFYQLRAGAFTETKKLVLLK